MSQAADYLSSKHEALNSNSSTTKKKKTYIYKKKKKKGTQILLGRMMT
jgi:hypothetical protein